MKRRRATAGIAQEIGPGGFSAGDVGGRDDAEDRGAGAPGWHRIAVPVSLVLALVLVVIGIWAVGAIIYMRQVSPVAAKDVHYPLIAWRFDAGPMGGYTAASRFMSWAMLLCLPVAGMLVVMAYLLGQGRKGQGRKGRG